MIDQSNNTTNKKVALIIAALGSFLTPFMVSSVNIALPAIGNEFSVDAVLLSWVAISYLLVASLFLVPFGKIADIHGRKKVFTYGISVYIIASFLCAISTSVEMLIFLRVLQGMGSAMIFVTGIAILSSIFPANERGKAFGITIAAVHLGLTMGPFIGGFMTEHLGWRSIFLVNVPVGLIVITLILLKLKGEWAYARGETYDFTGAVIYILSFASLIYGFSLLPKITGFGVIMIGVIGILIFIKWELKVKTPVLNIDLFRNNRIFAFSNLAALIIYSSTFAVGFLLSLYLQYIKGLSPQDAGLILVAQPIIMTIFSPVAGKLSDKFAARIIASAGMALTFTGLVLFIFLNKETTINYIIAGLIIIGLGLAFFLSPNTNAAMNSVEKKFYGVASATLGTMRLTGQMLGMGITMLIFALYIGNVQITPEYYHSFMESMKTAFVVFAVLCFIGIFASIARGKGDNKI